MSIRSAIHKQFHAVCCVSAVTNTGFKLGRVRKGVACVVDEIFLLLRVNATMRYRGVALCANEDEILTT
jgi:hypothetical protein